MYNMIINIKQTVDQLMSHHGKINNNIIYKQMINDEQKFNQISIIIEKLQNEINELKSNPQNDSNNIMDEINNLKNLLNNINDISAINNNDEVYNHINDISTQNNNELNKIYNQIDEIKNNIIFSQNELKSDIDKIKFVCIENDYTFNNDKVLKLSNEEIIQLRDMMFSYHKISNSFNDEISAM